MDWLNHGLWPGGHFLGIEWHAWKVVGWLGNVTFFSRFLVQWYATEKQGRVVVPPAFWWLSLAGASLLFAYALFYQRDSVFIFAYAFTWIPYVRNLIIHRRTQASQPGCDQCGAVPPVGARFCPQCGRQYAASAGAAGGA
jgi:lipid-A-disaccharide synthase-like uncharacterized protein